MNRMCSRMYDIPGIFFIFLIFYEPPAIVSLIHSYMSADVSGTNELFIELFEHVYFATSRTGTVLHVI